MLKLLPSFSASQVCWITFSSNTSLIRVIGLSITFNVHLIAQRYEKNSIKKGNEDLFSHSLNLLMGVEEKHLFPLFYRLCLLLKFIDLRCVQAGSFCFFRLLFD